MGRYARSSALALALMVMPPGPPAFAAPPYQRNSAGTGLTGEGTLDALTDIYGLSGCVFSSTVPTLIAGQRAQLRCDGNGNLLVSGGGGGGGGSAVYGPNAIGGAPTQPPIFNGYVGASGNILGASPTTPLPAAAYDQRATNVALSSALNSTIDIPLNGAATVGLRFTGLAASGATISYFTSNDAGGTPNASISSLNASTGVVSATRTTDGDTRIPVGGHAILRLQVTTAGTGPITVAYNVSAAGSIVDIRSPLPAGTNSIGTVSISGTLPSFATAPTFNVGTMPSVTIGNFPTTQPVSWSGQSVSLTGALPAGTNAIGSVVDTNSAAFLGAVAMTVGATYAAQRSIAALCTAGGNMTVTFADASTLVVPVAVGFQTFPFAVTAVNTSGTTATCTYANLK